MFKTKNKLMFFFIYATKFLHEILTNIVYILENKIQIIQYILLVLIYFIKLAK